MRTSILKRKRARATASIAAASLALGASVLGGSAAHADPRQFLAFTGVGSDTIQDVTNALAGFSNNVDYTPVRSSAASGGRGLASWNAFGSGSEGTACITPKAPGATINRPNGSSQGRRALSRAIDGTNYGTTACGAAAKPVAGLIDFARSSAGPNPGDAGTDLTYVPVGRDAVSFAYYRASGTPVTSLTRQNLIDLYQVGPQTIGGVRIVACSIQSGSGTRSFWLGTALGGITDTNEATATAECRNASTPAQIEENKPDQLKAKGDTTAMTNSANCPVANPCEVVIGMSAGSFIAQTNGRAPSFTAAGVDLGSVTDNGSGTNLGLPYSGTAPNLTPRASFYGDGAFGRSVYFVIDTAKATGFGNNDFKSMFVNTATPPANNAAICQPAVQTNIVNAFGFLTPSDCGSVTLTGSLLTGTL